MNNQTEIISIYPELGNIDQLIENEHNEFIASRRYDLETMHLYFVTASMKN